MRAILTGIYSAYNANAALKAALTGGLHLEIAPQAATLPYGTYFIVGSGTEYWLGNKLFELPTIQFDIYAKSNTERLTCYETLIAVFDDARPTVTGYTSVIMERTYTQSVRDGDTDEIYRMIVTYECRFQKT